METVTEKQSTNGKSKTKVEVKEEVIIKAPDIRLATFDIVGDAPLVINKFSTRKKRAIMDTQEAGSQSRFKKVRAKREFERDYEEAKYTAKAGWNGISALSFKAALVSACRICGFAMTRAKLAIFVVPDGFDQEDGTPLVKILRGKPEMHIGSARNESGVIDLRARPMWKEWGVKLQVRYDNEVLSISDLTNLVLRAGMQVGVAEGRPDSKKSLTGMGWGTFAVQK